MDDIKIPSNMPKPLQMVASLLLKGDISELITEELETVESLYIFRLTPELDDLLVAIINANPSVYIDQEDIELFFIPLLKEGIEKWLSAHPIQQQDASISR
jgi:hypothetical protein